MKRIELTQGRVALVDDEDYEWLSQWKWHALCNHGNCYASRHVRTHKGQYPLGMHRAILGLKAGDGLQGDHISGDGLDNQRYNLRICTNKQNARNRRSHLNTTSAYKGVSRQPHSSKWKAQIRVDNKLYYLGLHEDEVGAARVYDNNARRYFGEFAKLNFPKGDEHEGN